MATALDKGQKAAARGLSLFDEALAHLHLSNSHLEDHAAASKAAIDSLTAEHNEAVDNIVKNKGVIARLEALLHGES